MTPPADFDPGDFGTPTPDQFADTQLVLQSVIRREDKAAETL